MKQPEPNPSHLRYTPREGICGQSGLDIHRDAPEQFESCWNGSGDYGNFRIHKTEIRTGFDIWMTDYLARENTCLSVNDHPAFFSFSFCLSGKVYSRLWNRQQSFEMSSGKQGVFYCPDANGCNYINADQPFRQIGIVISPERLHAYFDSDLNSIHSDLRNILEGKRNNLFCNIQAITPAMRVALQQLLNCPFGGLNRKLFLESRALELITYSMDQLAAPEPDRQKTVNLRPDDLERVRQAEKVLIRSLENPPSLLALARQVGINRNKLNRGFRQVFGTSVFDHLRTLRLERARELLEREQKSVTEAAFDVGYTHQRNFSRAFKNHFGTNPKDHLR